MNSIVLILFSWECKYKTTLPFKCLFFTSNNTFFNNKFNFGHFGVRGWGEGASNWDISFSWFVNFTWGQSYKTFYTYGQIYKPVLKRDNMLWLKKYLVILLGCCTLKYSWSCFFLRGAISNLGTLFYTNLRLKKFYRIGPSSELRCIRSHLASSVN